MDGIYFSSKYSFWHSVYYVLSIYCLDTALTLTERFDAITLCSIDRKQEASGLNTKDIYSKIVIFWQMEIKWKINI